MSRILVVGSANIDFSIVVSKMPEQGETIKCLESRTSPGGKGANQAVAAAKMGSDVCMAAKIGDDVFGKMIIDNLRKNGVNTEYITLSKDVGTGKAFINICDGDNRIIIDGGCNDKLTVGDIERFTDKLPKWDAVMLQFEIPLESVKKTIEICKGKVPIFLNPAPAVALEKEYIHGIDYFTPNETECFFYTGISPKDKYSTEKALNILRSYGIRFPVITLGSKGAAYFNGEKNVIVNGFKIEPVDSTAAGDTFSGVFASMLCSGCSIDEAVEGAQAAAAIACTRYGAQDSIPFKDEVITFLKKSRPQ